MRPGLDTVPRQVMGEAIGALLQFGKGDLPVAADDRGAIRNGVDGVLDEICEVECHSVKVEHVIVLGNGHDRRGPPMAEPHALVEARGHTLVVTMNRPTARNALSGEMLEIMVGAWNRVDEDAEIRACVLTGAGGAFCAGADLKSMARN